MRGRKEVIRIDSLSTGCGSWYGTNASHVRITHILLQTQPNTELKHGCGMSLFNTSRICKVRGGGLIPRM